ncbi:hypothetical protein IGI43_002540 [Enterococcus sp. AZ126]
MCIILFFVSIIFFVLRKNNLIVFQDSTYLLNFSTQSHIVYKEIDDSVRSFLSIPLLLVNGYVFYLGSNFFGQISDGCTPFSVNNYLLLKKVGAILIITNLLIPIIHSILLSINSPQGYYISIGISIEVLVGFIIYCLGEVFEYGVSLQNLSDETV